MKELFIVFLCVGVFCTGIISMVAFILAAEILLIINSCRDNR